jgi:hypothetical protein
MEGSAQELGVQDAGALDLGHGQSVFSCCALDTLRFQQYIGRGFCLLYMLQPFRDAWPRLATCLR